MNNIIKQSDISIPNFNDKVFKRRKDEELELEKKLQKEYIKTNKVKVYKTNMMEYELEKREDI